MSARRAFLASLAGGFLAALGLRKPETNPLYSEAAVVGPRLVARNAMTGHWYVSEPMKGLQSDWTPGRWPTIWDGHS